MDDRRFDNAVRALARHRSRRGLVGSLLGGGAALLAARLRLPGAAAQGSYVPQGEWCVDDNQCDPWLTCDWNGFGSAGAACCAFVGGSCDDDFGCCGPATCFGGVCTDMTAAPSPGEPCQPGGNPCVYASGSFYCGYVEWTGDYRCCASQGGRCGGNETCCGSNICVGGVCTSQGAGAGAGGAPAVGDPCQTTDQCRRPVTGAICAYTVSTGDNRCCWDEGECISDAQCCGSRTCAGGFCQLLDGSSGASGTACTWQGCACQLYRDPECRASCPLYDRCDPGLACSGGSDYPGTCVPA